MILSYKEQKCKTPKESVASALFMVYAKERKKGGIDLEQGICAFTATVPGILPLAMNRVIRIVFA